jgi:iron complex transport system ATP-binding protein
MDLSADNLSIVIDGRRLVDGVSAVFRSGRVTAILGPGGSGKSMLARALAGGVDGDGGFARLGGRAVGRMTAKERARAIAYLPEDGAPGEKCSVRDLVGRGRRANRTPFATLSAEDRRAIDAALAATGLETLADRRVDQLSGGERARAALARALAAQPQWLIVDAPFAHLDPVQQVTLGAQLRALAGEGMGVVILLHDPVQAAQVADDVLLLREGRVVVFGTAAEALAHQPLRDAFGVEVIVIGNDAGRLLPVPIGFARA